MNSQRKHPLRRRNRAGAAFTLIELLVVISIIMLLAALALPVLARASRQARAAQCVGNLRQLAVAFKAYTGNHDGTLPGQYWCGTPTWLMGADPQTESLSNFLTAPQEGQLFPYYREPDLVRCPSDRQGNGRFSYSCCVNIRYRLMEMAEAPTAAVLILGEHETYYMNHPSYPQWRDGGFSSQDRPAARHGGRTGVAYFDCHAALVEFPPGTLAREFETKPWGFSVITPWP